MQNYRKKLQNSFRGFSRYRNRSAAAHISSGTVLAENKPNI